MALTEYTLDDQSVGQTLTPADGFLTGLTMTTPPPQSETPDHDPAKQHFTSAYFTIRGERDLRDLVNVSPRDNGGAFSWWGPDANMVVDGSLPYAGGLVVVGVPKGSVWSLSLSDVPIVRTPPPPGSRGVPFGNSDPTRSSGPRQLGVTDRAAALERQMRPRQLSDARRSAANRA